MKKNAIILAAGKSNRIAPFTYEKPKGLFCVKGDILIERQIEQLIEAGIDDIYVIVGYMKEKFFYLEQKYGVHLLVNNNFGEKGNIYSLYIAREFLSNTYICCADHYFTDNPFIEQNEDNHSYRACTYIEGKFKEFAVCCSDADVITELSVGGTDSLAMVGHAYFNERFSAEFRELMSREINDFGVASMFWEEFFAKHIRELTLYKKQFDVNTILEFDNIDDLRRFDSEFLLNVDSEIISNICSVVECTPNDITDITVINAGLTNVSFAFEANGLRYVYRHPGGTAGNLTDRKTELFAQTEAGRRGLDKSYIHMELSGWKISHYVSDAKNCCFLDYPEQLSCAIEYINELHGITPAEGVKVFDDVEEGKRLMHIASATKGNLMLEFADIVSKVEKLYAYVKEDAKRLGYGLVLCHNDTYEPNFLCDADKRIYLIDWEYAGMNYAANDICCITCRYDWTDSQIEMYFEKYAGHSLSEEERRFYWAFHPICGFYWFCWGLYKGSMGDDDGFFFLPAYRNLVKYIDRALESYERQDLDKTL